MYKDKDKQKETQRERQRRYRAERGLKAYPKGVTESRRDTKGVTDIERDKAIEFMAKTAGKVERAEPKRGKDIKCFADLPPDVQVTIDRLSLVDGKIDHTDKAKRTAAAIKYQHLFPHKFDNPGPLTDAELVAVTGKPGDADYNGICTPEWVKERKGAAS